ncbi:doxX family protein [Mycobacterium xenopi 3993]|nr:doxX family protein [Mycobacterium xenopi 3993]
MSGAPVPYLGMQRCVAVSSSHDDAQPRGQAQPVLAGGRGAVPGGVRAAVFMPRPVEADRLAGGPTVPVGEWPFYYAGWIETVTAGLIIVGLLTRLAAFVACGEMAYAYFSQHFPHGFWPIVNQGELAVLYCFGFLLLVFVGAGAYALDTRRRTGRR